MEAKIAEKSMSKITKRLKTLQEKVDANKNYSIDEAIATVKTLASAKFDETVEVALAMLIKWFVVLWCYLLGLVRKFA